VSEQAEQPRPEPVVIKKYANRRLYNTATSSYVTLDDLAELVRKEVDFIVYDAKSGEDITRAVLAQIIFDEENKGSSLLPISFLQQLIRLYGDSMQTFLPSYLELSMKTFARNQEKLKERLATHPPFKMFEEQVRQNMALIERAMSMFSPFTSDGSLRGFDTAPSTSKNEEGRSQDELAKLRNEMENMRAQIDALQRGDKAKTGSE
jgi:polyhydroxyalkanoate synthesis repressor PhaR